MIVEFDVGIIDCTNIIALKFLTLFTHPFFGLNYCLCLVKFHRLIRQAFTIDVFEHFFFNQASDISNVNI